uniref:Uncharacterized protein n=1 Tax=Daphnia galeata TaxID=27404 RepID=A0A8J2RPC8_9CRUS|nr:unnamed protein product [Daphnia galeata]
MSRKFVTLMCWLFAFFMLTEGLQVTAVDKKVLEQENPLAVLSFITKNIPITQEKPLNETVTNCPNLWTETKKQLTGKEETGFFGSFTDLQRLCPEKSQNLSLVCNAAIWVSNYVCTASQEDKRQLPVIQDVKSLTNVSDLCNALVGNENFTQKLCGIVEDRMQKTKTLNLSVIIEKLEKSCSLPQLGSNNCEQYCSGENLYLCKIILHSLRTIISWEEKKETMLKEMVVITETESPPTVTKAATPNPPSKKDSITTPAGQQNPTQQGNGTLKVKEVSSVDATTQSATTATTIKSDTEKLSASSGVGPKTTKFPSTDIDSLVNTDTTVTDEDFGLDDTFGSADKPPIKTADEDPQSYEVGDEVDKEEKSMDDKQVEQNPVETQKAVPSYDASSETDSDPINTHFLFYFIAFVILSACGYLMFMRRKYLIALVLEGRTSSSRRRSNSFRERPSSGNYRKLVNNLEEAITSNSVKNSNVIY